MKKRKHRRFSAILSDLREVHVALEGGEHNHRLGHMLDEVMSAEAAADVREELVDAVTDGFVGYLRAVAFDGLSNEEFGRLGEVERTRRARSAIRAGRKPGSPGRLAVQFLATTLAWHWHSDQADHPKDAAWILRSVLNDPRLLDRVSEW